jgi:hypothetical protein
MTIKGSAKDQPSYRMIQSIDAEALTRQAAEYFRLDEPECSRKPGAVSVGTSTNDGAIASIQRVKQRMIAERLRGLDEGFVSRDRRAIREQIETEPSWRPRTVSQQHHQAPRVRV